MKALYVARIRGAIGARGGWYRDDKWWRRYAGREYGFEHGKPGGIEVPASYFELFANPARMARQTDPAANPHAGAFAETLKRVMSIFYKA